MPLPKTFYNIEDEEVTLEQLCHQEPYWAASIIRYLTKQLDEKLIKHSLDAIAKAQGVKPIDATNKLKIEGYDE